MGCSVMSLQIRRDDRRLRAFDPEDPSYNDEEDDGEIRILVKYSATEDVGSCSQHSKYGEPDFVLRSINVAVYTVDRRRARHAMRRMQETPGVDMVEYDQPVYALSSSSSSSSPFEALQQHLRGIQNYSPEPEIPYGIKMVQAPEVLAAAKAEGREPTPIKFCIIDTGYGMGHPDLPSSPHVTGFNSINDGHAFIDRQGHGSHVAGVIGAVGKNKRGLVGVNPDDSKFSFHIAKAMNDTGIGTSTAVLQSLDSCVEAGAKIASMSLSMPTPSEITGRVFQHYYENDLLVIAAAGNEGDNSHAYPASFPHVVSVAAVNEEGHVASFSQYNDQVELAAPGVLIKSTFTANDGTEFMYRELCGTSMATPHVSGVAGLVWSYFPECTNHQIRNVLLLTAKDMGSPGCDDSYGFGLVQAKAAYDLISEKGCSAGGEAVSVGKSPGGCKMLESLNANSERPSLSADEEDLMEIPSTLKCGNFKTFGDCLSNRCEWYWLKNGCI